MADDDKIQFQNLRNKKAIKSEKTLVQTPVKKESKKEDKKTEEVKEIKEEKTGEVTESKEDKKEKKKPVPIIKKDNSKVYGRALRISLKQSVAIGKFIKHKKIENAIRDLELVIRKKMPVPMVGELAHKRGKGIMSAKYPLNTSKEFIQLLKTLKVNSIANGMEIEKTRITEVIPNKAPDRMHRSGRTKFKQTHILIKAREVNQKEVS